MKKIIPLFALLIIATLFVSGCTAVGNLTKTFCEPDYVRPSTSTQVVGALAGEDCKSMCYRMYKVTSYKVENRQCSCDINDCKKNE